MSFQRPWGPMNVYGPPSLNLRYEEADDMFVQGPVMDGGADTKDSWTPESVAQNSFANGLSIGVGCLRDTPHQERPLMEKKVEFPKVMNCLCREPRGVKIVISYPLMDDTAQMGVHYQVLTPLPRFKGKCNPNFHHLSRGSWSW